MRSLAALIIIAAVIHGTCRDQWLVTAIIYYATPLPLLLLGSLFVLIMRCHSSQQRWRTVLWGILTASFAMLWIAEDWRFGNPVPPSDTINLDESLKVLFWNVGRQSDLIPSAEVIKERDADIVGLVEVEGDVQERKAFFRSQLPDYDISALGAGMYLLCKGTAGDAIPYNLPNESELRVVPVKVNEIDYEIFVIDIHAHPAFSRAPALRELAERADESKNNRVIILGDFNTPAGSVHLKPLRAQQTLAFEQSGWGYGGTWPNPLPLMQIDQIWTNTRAYSSSCRHLYRLTSDHQPVEAIIHPSR